MHTSFGIGPLKSVGERRGKNILFTDVYVDDSAVALINKFDYSTQSKFSCQGRFRILLCSVMCFTLNEILIVVANIILPFFVPTDLPSTFRFHVKLISCKESNTAMALSTA
jgi:hypothetical protein